MSRPSRTLAAPVTRIGPRTFTWGARTYLMGVINVSPESFSGDGIADPETAVAQARRFVDEGADILDVGGQSTRPGKNKTEAGFDELTPETILAAVKPDVHVKGDDYANKPIPERAIVESYGGRIELIPRVPDRSSTTTLSRLLD